MADDIAPALQTSMDLDTAALKANRERDDEEQRRTEESAKATEREQKKGR